MFINPYSTYCHSPLQYHYRRRAAIVEKREHMFLRAMSKAMRYYRIWIYSCNVALFVGTLIYFVAFLTVITDSRLNFFNNFIRLHEPSLIYSYCAILIQGGLLQVKLCTVCLLKGQLIKCHDNIFLVIVHRQLAVLVPLNSTNAILIFTLSLFFYCCLRTESLALCGFCDTTTSSQTYEVISSYKSKAIMEPTFNFRLVGSHCVAH